MKKYLLSLLAWSLTMTVSAQDNMIDKIIAVVGEEFILKSDIENEFLQEQGQGLISASSDYRTDILERQLIQKLLLAQAQIDTIEVSDEMVESEVNNRLAYFKNVLGSTERIESYFNKNMDDIRSELRSTTRDVLITQDMQRKITEKVRCTPSEVRAFYKKLPKDSLPEIPDKYEIQQIVIKPRVSDAERERIRNQLRDFREQILSGKKSFSTLAVLYSQDGSATRGGELGYMAKTEMVPEFADAAFNLKPDKISKIVETEFGFHIIQLIDRQGEKINVRHIILQPKVSEEEKEEASKALDTLRMKIIEDKITFESAAFYYSTDKNSKNNGGLYTSGNSESKIERGNIPGDMAKVVNKMKVGDISFPFIQKTERGEEIKIVKIRAFYPKHTANLEDDWLMFENMLLNEKKQTKLEKWIKEKQENTYIHIDDEYLNSKFKYDGWIK